MFFINMYFKMGALKISQYSQENTCVGVCNFIKKETLAQLFFCEYCEIFKNCFFYKTPPVTNSGCSPSFAIFVSLNVQYLNKFIIPDPFYYKGFIRKILS